MAFYQPDPASLVKFNSAVSHSMYELYTSFYESEIRADAECKSSQTVAPSSFRCARKTWFRLRGTQPDSNRPVDRTLSFTAMLGTACHEDLQGRLIRLSKMLESAGRSDEFHWVDVEDYLAENPIPYEYQIRRNGYETQIEITSPFPVKLACDGIVKIRGVYYLLEIKSSENSSFSKLTAPKEHHIDQIHIYCALLRLHNTLVIYVDRQYGELKMYTKPVPQYVESQVTKKIDTIIESTRTNIAPPALPKTDKFCLGCNYAQSCAQWGRD